METTHVIALLLVGDPVYPTAGLATPLPSSARKTSAARAETAATPAQTTAMELTRVLAEHLVGTLPAMAGSALLQSSAASQMSAVQARTRKTIALTG